MAKKRLEEIRKIRLHRVKKLREMGIDPYPSKVDGTPKPISKALKSMGKTSEVAGRIMALRTHGNVSFADLKDESGTIQLWFQKDSLGEDIKVLRYLDIGDFLYVKGKVVKTKAGETSVDVAKFQLLTKSIRPIPSTWYGLKDVEEKYRKRYLDMLVNPETKKLLDNRWLIEKEVRMFLWDKGYKEVETSILQELYGGTNAKPFTTHMNALNSDYYLRIAPELYLKRLIVGGYEKVFEIARNFRNEGIDATHQPEFTMIEWYEAYGDYNSIMDTTEELTKHLVKKMTGGSKLLVNGKKIDISGKWPRVSMVEIIKKYLKVDVENENDGGLKRILEKNEIKLTSKFSRGKAIFSIFEHLVTGQLIEPIWVIDYPIEVCPLQKRHPNKTKYAERFEGYIGGVEYCDGWTEITSSQEQRKRFEVEQDHLKQGDKEAHPLDEDFVEVLEYGMPPAGGIGIGIDRLVMFLTDTWSIKKVIAFPTLRPKKPRK
jgi:lysyl-tRNA synthetase class 2